jgi:hypothetical protein
VPDTAPQVEEIFHDRVKIAWDNAAISNQKGATVNTYKVFVSRSPAVHEMLSKAAGKELHEDEDSALRGAINMNTDEVVAKLQFCNNNR